MARNRGKKALYEVMSKARIKPGHGRAVEQIQTKKPEKDEPATNQKSALEIPKATAKWWRKPRTIQFNAGRIEFSMPYPLAVALVLVLVFLILAAYRLGQFSYMTDQRAPDRPGGEIQKIDKGNSAGQAKKDIIQPSTPAQDKPPTTKKTEPVKSTGNNVIVLVQYHTMSDLGPVQAHFAEYGIETEIVMEKGRYFLQTKQRYDNPATPGTDGYKARQKIIEVGAKYKAPANYETFAKHLFSDAYGRKVE